MGFRTGAWATCWEATPKSDTLTTVRLSTSRKDKATGEYVQDFSGYVSFIGAVAAKKAAGLKPKDRLRLGDCDVTTNYVKEKNRTYTNFKCFGLELGEESGLPQRNSIDGDSDEFVQSFTDEADSRLPF